MDLIKCFRISILGIVLISTSLSIYAQDFIIPTTNSKATINQTIASTEIEVIYHRPNKKGREIFGQLVPYGQVWRTGADAATEIHFSTPVSIEGKSLDSGKYELFSIPDKDSWQFIFQKYQGQWGSYSYNRDNNAAIVTVKPMKTSNSIETFTISIDNVTSNSGELTIAWDHVIVSAKIKVDLRKTVVPQLEALLKQEGRKPYFQAAMFYYENDIDINRAAELMSLALEPRPDHIGMLYRYALILERKGDISAAKAAAEKSLAGAQNAGDELKNEYIKLNTVLLDRLNHSK